MQVWRIAKQAFAADLAGTGAKFYGGRWNSAGVAVVYAGMSVEICAFETLVHTGDLLPADLMLVRINLPENDAFYKSYDAADLPAGWDEIPSSIEAVKFGDAFAREGRYLGIIVPSAIIPEARNIIINPAHSALAQVSYDIVRPFVFDGRLR